MLNPRRPSTLLSAIFLIPLVFFLFTAQMASSKAIAEQENIKLDATPGSNNVSSHVLDIAIGQPAVGVECTAYKWIPPAGSSAQGHWELWGETETNAQGRIPIVHPNRPLTAGIFKLHFCTKQYFESQERPTFYPYIEVVFEIEDPNVHYHVPITLSNFGYSTYKGQ